MVMQPQGRVQQGVECIQFLLLKTQSDAGSRSVWVKANVEFFILHT